ncbi:MAG TPA: prolipoprotein diacylglyceryl transferase family protein [Terriglobales bacterium]|nr:prolipoprotein diacylglyceryl transferase family protein [Terriglobales bacterium]
MDFPFYLHLGPWKLHPHWVFEGLGYALGFRLYLLLRGRWGDPIAAPLRWSIVAAAAAGAALGSKILYWFEDPWQTLQRWPDPAYLMAGKTIVGALIGGLVAVEWAKRHLGIRARTGDLFAIPLAIGTAAGRFGCFLTGLEDHTFGTPTTLPWGVDFGDGIARHPTQLYELIFLLLLAQFLWRRSRAQYESGDLFKMFMVGYLGFRLLVDFIKPGVTVAGLSLLQWACVGVLLYYARDLKRWLRVGERPATAVSG